MLYGLCSNHNFKTFIGAVYILEKLDKSSYLVKEGNCDTITKDAITLISKEEYIFIRKAHNEILKNINMFSENTHEYYENLCTLRNILNDKKEDAIQLYDEAKEVMNWVE